MPNIDVTTSRTARRAEATPGRRPDDLNDFYLLRMRGPAMTFLNDATYTIVNDRRAEFLARAEEYRRIRGLTAPESVLTSLRRRVGVGLIRTGQALGGTLDGQPAFVESRI